jgi:Ribonuclease P 40kDa (Rpp40) subunit
MEKGGSNVWYGQLRMCSTHQSPGSSTMQERIVSTFQVCFPAQSEILSAHAHLDDIASPLSIHHPTIAKLEPTRGHNPAARVPPLQPDDIRGDHSIADIEEWSHGVVEWLGLVSLESARIQKNDEIDPLLCRWTFPAGTTEDASPIRVLRWKGMMHPDWVTRLLLTCM